jgi:hypothetical protein
VLPKEVKQQIVRRVDQEVAAGNQAKTKLAFDFVKHVDGQRFLSPTARTYILSPLVKKLKAGRDEFSVEDSCVRDLEPYAAYTPATLLDDYVSALTVTYVGHIGSSSRFNRRDFYADGAALRIPKMFQAFDDKAAEAFVKAVRENSLLKGRVREPVKMRRLRSLGNIVLEKVSGEFRDIALLEALVDPEHEEEFAELRDGRRGR